MVQAEACGNRRAARVVPHCSAVMFGGQPQDRASSASTRAAVHVVLDEWGLPLLTIPEEIPGVRVDVLPMSHIPPLVQRDAAVYEARLRRIVQIINDGIGAPRCKFWFIAELIDEWEWQDSDLDLLPPELRGWATAHRGSPPPCKRLKPGNGYVMAVEPAAADVNQPSGSAQDGCLAVASCPSSAAAAGPSPNVTDAERAALIEQNKQAALARRAAKDSESATQPQAAGTDGMDCASMRWL